MRETYVRSLILLALLAPAGCGDVNVLFFPGDTDGGSSEGTTSAAPDDDPTSSTGAPEPDPSGGSSSSTGELPGEGSESGSSGGSSEDETGEDMPPALDPGVPPGDNFELEHWKLTLPDASEVTQEELVGGFEDESFHTDPETGGMVFHCPNHGETTSSSTSYSRSELREMLRDPGADVSTTGINANNWVTSTSSEASRSAAGGVDGHMEATLTVDHVSTTADETSKVGRVIVGQIHGPDDEPCKLYYRKLPGNAHGSVYFAFEPLGSDDVIIPLLGSPDSDAEDPADGIALGETWSYFIDVQGQTLTVGVTKPDGTTVMDSHEMGDDYDDAWLYFKAGVYNQNDGGDEDDFVQATFYALSHEHD